jgi:hypothetical protein
MTAEALPTVEIMTAEALPTVEKLLAIDALEPHTHAHAKNKHACHKSKQACHKHTSDDR